jgi:Ca2+/Na+ antiporter
MHLTSGEILGSIGVTLLLIAFLMNLLKKWSQESLSYILLNTVGAGLSCASSVVIHFVPFIILEGVWTLVSLVALIKYFTSGKA